MAEDEGVPSSSNNYHFAGLGILLVLVAIGMVACYNRFGRSSSNATIPDLPPTSTAVPGISETAMPEPTSTFKPETPAQSFDVGPLKAYDSSGFSLSYPASGRFDGITEMQPRQVVRIENVAFGRTEGDTELGDHEFYLEMFTKEGGDDCRNQTLDAQTETVDGVTTYRGNAAPGSYHGYRSTLCFNRAGSYYEFNVTEGAAGRFIAKAIFDSLRIKP